MIPNVNASGSNKNILNEFYDINTFANMENYVSFQRMLWGMNLLKNNN